MRSLRCGVGVLVIALALSAAALACKRKDADSTREDSNRDEPAAKMGLGEEEYVKGELKALKAALVKRSVTEATIGCTSVTTGLDHFPAAMKKEIERLCYVDAPRLYLELAIADTKQHNAEHPELSDINCMNLFVEDAYKAIAEHPSDDETLVQLADEYAKLCPEQVAKYRKQ